MGAVGATRKLLEPSPGGGLVPDIKTDVMMVRMQSGPLDGEVGMFAAALG